MNRLFNDSRSLVIRPYKSAFIRLVALHSGVFLRRQYLQFAGISSGKHATSFLGRLIENGHCRTYPWPARSLPITSTRRQSTERSVIQSFAFVDLMVLITLRPNSIARLCLAESQGTHTHHEQKKLNYFTHDCNVPLSDLPGRMYRSPQGKTETIRYFVDKFPLFLSPAAVVHFTFVSTGELPRLEEFRSHLLVHSKLFRHLKEVRLVYIHQDSFHVPQAEACFHTMLSSPNRRYIDSPALLRYIQLRLAWEKEEYEKVNSEGLIYLNQSQKKYAGSRNESLYQDWKNQAANENRSAGTLKEYSLRGQFLQYRINVNPRTFMATRRAPTGNKPAKSSLHYLVHRCVTRILLQAKGKQALVSENLNDKGTVRDGERALATFILAALSRHLLCWCRSASLCSRGRHARLSSPSTYL